MKRLTLTAALAVFLVAVPTASAATRAVDDDGQATPRSCDAADPASPTVQGAIERKSQIGGTARQAVTARLAEWEKRLA